jgi:hypothetical protein
MRPPVRRVALDARHVADAPIEALRALWSRGFLLSIPMSTFCHWLSDAIDGSYEGHASGRVLDRLVSAHAPSQHRARVALQRSRARRSCFWSSC